MLKIGGREQFVFALCWNRLKWKYKTGTVLEDWNRSLLFLEPFDPTVEKWLDFPCVDFGHVWFNSVRKFFFKYFYVAFKCIHLADAFTKATYTWE